MSQVTIRNVKAIPTAPAGVNLVAVCRSIMSEVRYVVSKNTGIAVKSVDVCVDSMRM